MTIRAQESQIFNSIIMMIAVDMINVKSYEVQRGAGTLPLPEHRPVRLQ